MSSLSGNLGSVQGNIISPHYQINIPSASHTNSAQRPCKLPRRELLHEGKREEFLEICFPLCQASMSGDWEAAQDILNKHKELVRFSINMSDETALHVAVYAGQTLFVRNLVGWMEKDDMELQNSSSNTALCLAALAGHVEIAEILVTKHKALLNITGSQEKMPLYIAASSGNGHMVKYLYQNSNKMTGNPWTDETRGCVLGACVEAELFDAALQIIKDRPELAVSEGSTILQILARKHHSFRKEHNYIEKYCFLYDGYEGHVDEGNQAIQLLKNIWENIVKLPKAKIDEMLRGPPDQIRKDKYPSRVLFVAAEMGNTAFIVVLIRQHPELVLELNDSKQSIFHVAISHRHSGVYSVLHQIGSVKDLIINLEDEKGNNMLHLVGLPDEKEKRSLFDDTEGPVLKMRQELQWSKAVSNVLPPSLRAKKNKDGLTPHELFIKNHRQLVFDGVDWIRKASSDLMVVVVLTAGITFASTITFVGGYNQETGKPVFSQNEEFNFFLQMNSLSFLLASTSIYILLSISGSHQYGIDILMSLMRRFTIAILSLCHSVVCMVIAFSINYTLLLPKKYIKGQYFLRIYSYLVCMLFLHLLACHYVFLILTGFQPHRLLFRPKAAGLREITREIILVIPTIMSRLKICVLKAIH